ncbi:101 kDa malaria antigen-like isoform X3 [Vigna unguiculata]|uniref:101 kDa malaria antigen-like isoform X3 n=1 Tax=Vigna unguiculata TaxID=3917 RepID=UPI001015F7CE|nr:101 kDa malaria antigen-like isoform X3 [Vigna unguiculata]
MKILNLNRHMVNKRMLRLRRKSVEKRNSRGDIVRKEEVVTLTKKFHASNKAQEKIPDWKPTSKGGSTKPNVKYSDTEGSDAEGSEVEDEEGSDAEDTNSKESEAEDNNSDESEDNNSEESEVDEETNSEESEAEDNNSEKSGTEDINSEESSEAEEDSDEEPPRRLIDLPNPSTRRRLIDMPNPSTRRHLTDIDQGVLNSFKGWRLIDIDRLNRLDHDSSMKMRLIDIDRLNQNSSMKMRLIDIDRLDRNSSVRKAPGRF